MQRAIFLDRDGVINAMVYHPEFGIVDSPSNPAEFRILPGVGDSIKQIHALGYLAIVISNQPGIAKGKYTHTLLDATHAKMELDLAQVGAQIDGIYYCLHHPDAVLEAYRAHCDCRKPRPGLLLQAAQEWQIDLKQSFFIGDGITDVVAGQAAGCKTILVNGRKCYHCDELARQNVAPDFIAKNLPAAVQLITAINCGDTIEAENFRFCCTLK